MKLLIDLSILIGLLTLIVLEIVLGVDNLIFISILTNSLPPEVRDRARLIGLLLALVMRFFLLFLISWIITLTKPLFILGSLSFSIRNLIMFFGGVFLLFKAITELYYFLKNKKYSSNKDNYSSFWIVVIQIVILDLVFSLDTVVTAISIVNNLFIMMVAVVISTIIMLLTSSSLTKFISKYKNIVILCLSFLLIIGISLIFESLGIYISKNYLYTAIGFSIFVEIFNQISYRNLVKNCSIKSIHNRTEKIIIRLMKSKIHHEIYQENFNKKLEDKNFTNEKNSIINNTILLTSSNLINIMTPRNKISWIDCKWSIEKIYEILINVPYNMFPICIDKLDNIIGVVYAKDIIVIIHDGNYNIKEFAMKNPAIIVSENLNILEFLKKLYRVKGMILISNNIGIIQGLVTQSNLLEFIFK